VENSLLVFFISLGCFTFLAFCVKRAKDKLLEELKEINPILTNGDGNSDGGVECSYNGRKNHFDTQGYLIVKNLLSLNEVSELRNHFMDLSKKPIPGCFEPVMEDEGDDPLKRYPRMLHPHRVSKVAKRYMLNSKVLAVLRDLYGEEPLAAQSMFYFKPPRSRGQALHQDNFYLKVEPGTCIATWTAIDAADPDNGGMVEC
jgi:phytanoyl-CoA hydroxylase